MASENQSSDIGFSRGKLIGLILGIVLFTIFVFDIPGFGMSREASAVAEDHKMINF